MRILRRLEGESVIDWQNFNVIDAVRDAVSTCTAYPSRNEAVEVVQTHISTVFLTARYVFKFKRPVNMGFTDFRTLRQRRHFCREEIRLNRRLASGVYLAVVPLWSRGGAYDFAEGERIVDYAVVMRRLERERMMDYRVSEGLLTQEELDSVTRRLARFHARARAAAARALERPGPARTENSLQTLTTNWEENFQQTAPYINITIAEADFRDLEKAVFGFMIRNRQDFQQRERDGFIVDGHGDLRCEHIYLGDKIKIIDCIEFNDRFRIADVASDIAFLLMDLVALGHPEWSLRLLNRYILFSGDPGMLGFVPFYACYRAFVRGKVLSMKLSDKNLEPRQQQELLARARAFFQLALDFSRHLAPPVMLIMAGLMGTGKSRLGTALAERTGAEIFSSDIIRKELAGKCVGGWTGDWMADGDSRSEFGQGIYTDPWNQSTYGEMFQRAALSLSQHRPVILDASFASRKMRNAAYALARQQGAEAYVVECILPDAVTLERLGKREREGGSASDGRQELFADQKARFEKILEVSPGKHILLRTDRPVAEIVDEVLSHPGLHIPPHLFNPMAARQRAASEQRKRA